METTSWLVAFLAWALILRQASTGVKLHQLYYLKSSSLIYRSYCNKLPTRGKFYLY